MICGPAMSLSEICANPQVTHRTGTGSLFASSVQQNSRIPGQTCAQATDPIPSKRTPDKGNKWTSVPVKPSFWI